MQYLVILVKAKINILALGILPGLFFLIQLPAGAQTWKPVGNDVLDGGVHGFAVWNNQLAIGGSFNSPCGSKVALWDSISYNCKGNYEIQR